MHRTLTSCCYMQCGALDVFCQSQQALKNGGTDLQSRLWDAFHMESTGQEMVET